MATETSSMRGIRSGRAAACSAFAVLLAAALAVDSSVAAAQRTPRRQAPIEIRGTVPTPQVVTVRPREMPAYSRQVLVPRFFDHDFWPEIQLGYQMVPERQISGRTVSDTMLTRNDSSSTSGAPTPRMTAPTRPNFAPGSD